MSTSEKTQAMAVDGLAKYVQEQIKRELKRPIGSLRDAIPFKTDARPVPGPALYCATDDQLRAECGRRGMKTWSREMAAHILEQRESARADAAEAWRQRNEVSEQRDQLLKASEPRGSLDEWKRRAEAAEAIVYGDRATAEEIARLINEPPRKMHIYGPKLGPGFVPLESGPGISGTHAPSNEHYVLDEDLLAADVD